MAISTAPHCVPEKWWAWALAEGHPSQSKRGGGRRSISVKNLRRVHFWRGNRSRLFQRNGQKEAL